jgi:hypothetical protein
VETIKAFNENLKAAATELQKLKPEQRAGLLETLFKNMGGQTQDQSGKSSQ